MLFICAILLLSDGQRKWPRQSRHEHLRQNKLHNILSFSGAEIRSVCTEAGMYAIRARRKMATEKDFLEAVNKVIKAYAKFSSTPKYMTYN